MIVAPGVADQRVCVPARQRPVSRLSIRCRNGVKLLRQPLRPLVLFVQHRLRGGQLGL